MENDGIQFVVFDPNWSPQNQQFPGGFRRWFRMEPELGSDIEVSVVGLDGETFKAGSNHKQLQVDGTMVKW